MSEYLPDYEQFHDCRRCPAANFYEEDGVKRPVFPFVHGKGEPNYMILGMNPGADEIEHDSYFVGDSGQVLWELLGKGVEEFDCPDLRNAVVANLACCQFQADNGWNRGPTDEEYENCSPIFDHTWDYVQPDIVLGLGGDVMDKFDVSGSVGSAQGLALDREYRDHQFKLVPMYHTAYLVRRRGSKDEGDIRKRMMSAIETLCNLIKE